MRRSVPYDVNISLEDISGTISSSAESLIDATFADSETGISPYNPIISISDVSGTLSSSKSIVSSPGHVSLRNITGSILTGRSIAIISNTISISDFDSNWNSASSFITAIGDNVTFVNLENFRGLIFSNKSIVEAENCNISIDGLYGTFSSDEASFIGEDVALEMKNVANGEIFSKASLLSASEGRLSIYDAPSTSIHAREILNANLFGSISLLNTDLKLDRDFDSIFAGGSTNLVISLENSSIKSDELRYISYAQHPMNLTLTDSEISGVIIVNALTVSRGNSRILNCQSEFNDLSSLSVDEGEAIVQSSRNDRRTNLIGSSVLISSGSKLTLLPFIDGNTSSILYTGDAVVSDPSASGPCFFNATKLDFTISSSSLSTSCILIVQKGISSVQRTPVTGVGDYTELIISGDSMYDAIFDLSSFKLLTVYAGQNASTKVALSGTDPNLSEVHGLPGSASMIWPQSGNPPKFAPVHYPIFEATGANVSVVEKLAASRKEDIYWFDSVLTTMDGRIVDGNGNLSSETQFLSLIRDKCPPSYELRNSVSESYALCCIDNICIIPSSVRAEKLKIPSKIERVTIWGSLSAKTLEISDSYTSIVVEKCVYKGLEEVEVEVSAQHWLQLQQNPKQKVSLLVALDSKCSDSVDFKTVKINAKPPLKTCLKVKISSGDSNSNTLIASMNLSKATCNAPYIILGVFLGIVTLLLIALVIFVLIKTGCKK